MPTAGSDRRLASTLLAAPRTGIALLFVAAGLAYGGWAGSVAGIKAELGLSDGVLGAALLCVAAGAMVAMPVAGWLGARGGRWLLTASGLGLAATLPLPGLVTGAAGLAGVLLLGGAAAGSLDVVMNARASRFEQDTGRAVMSSFHAAFSLGGLLGAVLTAGCAAAGMGPRGGLLCAAAAVAACAVGHVLLDPEPGLSEARPARGGVRPGKLLFGIGLLCLLAFLTEGAVADWSGVFLRDVAGFTPGLAASGYAAFSAAMITARLLGDGWVRRWGSRAVLQGGAAIAAAGVALAMALPVASAAGFGLVGLGGANVAPVLFSAAGRAGPAASTGIAAVATLGYAGMLVGPPLIGGVAEWIGLRIALGVLLAAMLVIAACSRRFVR
ncbi:MAG: MFS transporter [Acetobacteraceae bacterium]|nr:MFS transporter [Acetobacteraceae bacterium]